jgi:uncharacterized protein
VSIKPAIRTMARQTRSTAPSLIEGVTAVDPVVHFEFPYEDPRRMAKFYQSAFGWQTKELSKDSGNYVLATTTETDERGPKRVGAINGGFFPRKKDWPGQHPSVVIAVEDMPRSMKKVAKAGRKVLGEPVEIPGISQYVSFTDSEGNRVAMLQPTAENMKKARTRRKKRR